jgi:2-polyprenyl-3-methyl-5-hydroxy-6-metoxy-1,4-benzoquinol methylase
MSTDETHSDRVRTYFDTHAEEWSRAYRAGSTDDRPRGANDVVLGERLRLALELTADRATGACVLDAGCGAGPLTVALAERGHRVTAVDLSPQMVELCRSAVAARGVRGSVELACGDVLEMGLEPASFDVVYALGFLQYQEDEVAALRGLGALLAPGGRLVVSGPNRRRIGNLLGLWDHVTGLRRRLASARGDGRPGELDQLLAISTNSYSLGRFRSLLAEAGLEHLAGRPHGYVSYALIGPTIGPGGELALHRFFTRASRVLPIGHFANDLVVLAARPGA